VSSPWFIDTAFVIALAPPRDAHHEVALHLSARASVERIDLVTSDAILLEIGVAFSRLAFRASGIEIIAALRSDPTVEIVSLNSVLFADAVALFAARTDKEWSLADCVSFEIMRARGITKALSTDNHFEQAGFEALMRAH